VTSTEVLEETIEEIEEISRETQGLEKCIKQLVQNAVKNVKYHSNLWKASLFIVEIVI
jgi:ribosomal protein L22